MLRSLLQERHDVSHNLKEAIVKLDIAVITYNSALDEFGRVHVMDGQPHVKITNERHLSAAHEVQRRLEALTSFYPAGFLAKTYSKAPR